MEEGKKKKKGEGHGGVAEWRAARRTRGETEGTRQRKRPPQRRRIGAVQHKRHTEKSTTMVLELKLILKI